MAGNQVLLVVGLEQSEDMELMLTKEVAVMVSMLEKAGYKVVVASALGQPITGGTTTLKPDLKLADVKVDDYVGFMFPCLAVDMDLPPPAEAVRIAKEAVAQGKPVAAQVGGVVTLAAAEVLNGKQFAFPEDPGAYMPGGIYKGTGVVQDGNIITSGTCPYMAMMMGRTDGTPELTQKLIDLLAETAGDPLSLAEAYQDAVNRHDVASALALFVDEDLDFYSEDFTARDKDALRANLEEGNGRGVVVEVRDCGPKGEALGCKVLGRDDYCIKAWCGLDVWHADLTLKPKDGKIQLMSSISSSAEDQKGLRGDVPEVRGLGLSQPARRVEETGAPAIYNLKGQPLGELASEVCKDYLDSQEVGGGTIRGAPSGGIPARRACLLGGVYEFHLGWVHSLSISPNTPTAASATRPRWLIRFLISGSSCAIVAPCSGK